MVAAGGAAVGGTGGDGAASQANLSFLAAVRVTQADSPRQIELQHGKKRALVSEWRFKCGEADNCGNRAVAD